MTQHDFRFIHFVLIFPPAIFISIVGFVLHNSLNALLKCEWSTIAHCCVLNSILKMELIREWRVQEYQYYLRFDTIFILMDCLQLQYDTSRPTPI